MNSKIDISLMDPTEFAISFLNSHFDSNIKSLTNLTDVINEIQDRKEEIECQVSILLFKNDIVHAVIICFTVMF